MQHDTKKIILMESVCNQIEVSSRFIPFQLRALEAATTIQELVDIKSIRLTKDARLGLEYLNTSNTTRRIGGRWLKEIHEGTVEFEVAWRTVRL